MVAAPEVSIDRPLEHFHQPLMGTMTPDDILNALRDDIEWHTATLRLQLNHLAPLEEACAADPVLLGKVVELRRRLEWAGQALNDLLD
jgi:hypothetical protein